MDQVTGTATTVSDRIYSLQLAQLEHDEKYHKDVVIMPLAERLKHMALHNAKYTGYFMDACEADNDVRMQGVLTDAFIITLATANTLNQDLGKAVASSINQLENLAALGTSFASELERNPGDSFGFIKAYASQTGQFAKACESWDHMENVPFHDLLRQSNLALFRLVVAEASLRQLDIEALYNARLRVVETRSIFNRTFSAKAVGPH